MNDDKMVKQTSKQRITHMGDCNDDKNNSNG